jgi:hypothetical protein
MKNKDLFELIEKLKKQEWYKNYKKALDYYKKYNKIEDKYITKKVNLKDYIIKFN